MSQLQDLFNYLDQDQIKSYLNVIYPVGCLYWTEDPNFNPNVSFVGRWQRLNKFIFAACDSVTKYNNNCEGGEEFVSLSPSSIPSHSHTVGSIAIKGCIGISSGDEDSQFFGDSSLDSYGALILKGRRYQSEISMCCCCGKANYMFGVHAGTVGGISYGQLSGYLCYSGSGCSHYNIPPWVSKFVWERLEDE